MDTITIGTERQDARALASLMRWEDLHWRAQASADTMYERGRAIAYHREYQRVMHSQPCDMHVPACGCAACAVAVVVRGDTFEVLREAERR